MPSAIVLWMSVSIVFSQQCSRKAHRSSIGLITACTSSEHHSLHYHDQERERESRMLSEKSRCCGTAKNNDETSNVYVHNTYQTGNWHGCFCLPVSHTTNNRSPQNPAFFLSEYITRSFQTIKQAAKVRRFPKKVAKPPNKIIHVEKRRIYCLACARFFFCFLFHHLYVEQVCYFGVSEIARQSLHGKLDHGGRTHKDNPGHQRRRRQEREGVGGAG